MLKGLPAAAEEDEEADREQGPGRERGTRRPQAAFKPIPKKGCVCLFLLKLFHVFTNGVFPYHHDLETVLDTCV